VLAQTASALECEPGSLGNSEQAKRIGRYELLELLGAGAAGVVYRAFDPELQRVVALKVLVGGAGQAAAPRKERILREARAMAQLSHPNVVTVFDVGVAAGAVFIVMEYVPGTTLERWLHARPRSPALIVRAFMVAGQGLAAAHAKRLAHRDFKAENVLVSREGQVRVTDFGLARSLDTAEPGVLAGMKGSDVTTRTRGLFGTPAYMAPELFDGHPANAASDQFSFSVALLGALLERHPFGADQGIQMSELVLRIRAQRIDFSGAQVPAALRGVLLRGLHSDPRARFPSMDVLLAAIEQALRASERPRRMLRVAALALVIGALVLGLTVLMRAQNRSPATLTGASTHRLPPYVAQVSKVIARKNAGQPALGAAPVPRRTSAEAPRVRPAESAPRERQPAKSSQRTRYDDALREPF